MYPQRRNISEDYNNKANERTQADVIVMLDSSKNFNEEEYTSMKEGLASLVDETFDLSPDLVRVGFVTYT